MNGINTPMPTVGWFGASKGMLASDLRSKSLKKKASEIMETGKTKTVIQKADCFSNSFSFSSREK